MRNTLDHIEKGNVYICQIQKKSDIIAMNEIFVSNL